MGLALQIGRGRQADILRDTSKPHESLLQSVWGVGRMQHSYIYPWTVDTHRIKRVHVCVSLFVCQG